MRERKREVKGDVFCGVVSLLLEPFALMDEFEGAAGGAIIQPSENNMPQR